MNEITIETNEGFLLSVEKDVFDDIELIEYIGSADDNPAMYPKILEIIAGPEQKKSMYAFYREKCGKLTVEHLSEIVKEIMDGVSKNS